MIPRPAEVTRPKQFKFATSARAARNEEGATGPMKAGSETKAPDFAKMLRSYNNHSHQQQQQQQAMGPTKPVPFSFASSSGSGRMSRRRSRSCDGSLNQLRLENTAVTATESVINCHSNF